MRVSTGKDEQINNQFDTCCARGIQVTKRPWGKSPIPMGTGNIEGISVKEVPLTHHKE